MDIVDELVDIRVLLDQRLGAEFEWMPYADMRILECIPIEFLSNRNIWHVNVPLIVFVIVEMHETD
ncbi:hypothetical protein Goshw_007872 [Gossypium schwendimanii]|uniref:Aminotransferase-like plant mobile domain-containing protein n=1 Tax=Gossypium schwendimanii TaxID=34291 RepID=A0A7J9KQR7_GOSSC|nr:hypothetical protein [Gossypium schwendimanii]